MGHPQKVCGTGEKAGPSFSFSASVVNALLHSASRPASRLSQAPRHPCTDPSLLGSSAIPKCTHAKVREAPPDRRPTPQTTPNVHGGNPDTTPRPKPRPLTPVAERKPIPLPLHSPPRGAPVTSRSLSTRTHPETVGLQSVIASPPENTSEYRHLGRDRNFTCGPARGNVYCAKTRLTSGVTGIRDGNIAQSKLVPWMADLDRANNI